MNLDNEQPFPEQPAQLPPARRRRARRALLPAGNDARSSLLEELARRAFPSFEFFLFSLLCGAVIGAGFLLDSQAILLLGVVLAPLLAPWVGFHLATVSGAGRFFLQTLFAFLISSALVFGSGFLTGLTWDLFPPASSMQMVIHTHLWWPNLFVLALGAVLLVVSFIRSEKWPILPSIMLSYSLFLPLSAAGIGLGSQNPEYWPNGILVFCVHLSLATILGLLTLVLVGFRPRRLPGCFLSLLISLPALAAFLWLSGIAQFAMETFDLPFIPSPTAISTSAKTETATQETRSQPTYTSTAEITPTPSLQIPSPQTPTDTITPAPTPVYARISSDTGQGANVRASPGSNLILTSLVNGTLVEILPEVEILDGITWLHIRTADGLEGWIFQTLVETATPAPNW